MVTLIEVVNFNEVASWLSSVRSLYVLVRQLYISSACNHSALIYGQLFQRLTILAWAKGFAPFCSDNRINILAVLLLLRELANTVKKFFNTAWKRLSSSGTVSVSLILYCSSLIERSISIPFAFMLSACETWPINNTIFYFWPPAV